MAKITVWFGIALIALAVTGFLLTGHRYPTSLIPAAFGLLLAILGGAARTEDAKRRKLFMHIAVMVGLLGFLATASSLVSVVHLFRGQAYEYPAAVEEKAMMALLTLIFVLLCVASFANSRRKR